VAFFGFFSASLSHFREPKPRFLYLLAFCTFVARFQSISFRVKKLIERAEVAAKEWEHTSKLKDSLEKAREACYIPLGLQSDISWLLKDGGEDEIEDRSLMVLRKAIELL